MTGLSAGAVRCEITPRTPCMLFGYAARTHPHERIHDPLFVRALCVRDPLGIEALVVSADILWYGAEGAAETKRRIHAELGIPPERVLLAGTHTHSAPATGGEALKDRWLPFMPESLKRWVERPGAEYFNREWRHVLVAQTVVACALARGAARPAVLRVARGASDIGVNRRERRPDGRIALGRNPAGPRDREVVGISFDRDDGRPVARLASFACHGVVMGQDSYAVSGDWPGAAAARIEDATGVPFLFLQGGSGNINPRIGPQGDFGPVAELGGEFAGVFLGLAWTPAPAGDAAVHGRLLPVQLPDKAGGGPRTIQVHGLHLGPVRITGFPGEVFSETAMAVKQAVEGPVMVTSYADHGDDGYLPVAEAYPEGGYEVDTSPYAPTAEAIARAALIDLVSNP